MPNTGGLRSSRRELYAHVIDSILLYGAPIWRCATETQAYIHQAEAVHRRACLRVISGRPHVSYDATYVIAGVPPLALLADERARIYQRRPEDVKEEERRETLNRCQDRWDRASKGRWTHRLIPNITEWVERGHGQVDYHLTQLLSGHDYFKSHSQRYDNTLSALCPTCPITVEDAEHVFFRCPRFHEERERLQQVLQEEIESENKHRQAHARYRRQLDGGSVFRAISRHQTEARGARGVKTIRTMLNEIDWLLWKDSKQSHDPTSPMFDIGERCHITDFVTRTGYKDEPEFDEEGRPLLHRTTALHHVEEVFFGFGWAPLVYDLFKIYDKFDVNYTDESGLSHFHVACRVGCLDIVEKFLEAGQDPNCIVKSTDDSALHLVCRRHDRTIIELLLRRGASPNLPNQKGKTFLHTISEERYDENFAAFFFELTDELNRPVWVDARDNLGNTPLRCIPLTTRNRGTLEMLLRRGADPNSANNNGETFLHAISEGRYDENFASTFFELTDELNRPVLVDARDNLGRTPLHLALERKSEAAATFLLTKGAGPNFADDDERTPLHYICRSFRDDDVVRQFFMTNKERNQWPEVDVRDKLGRTPLQWAVANFHPYMVDELLDNGADLSYFVFPTKCHFDECIENLMENHWKKLEFASGLLAVVELIEDRGYELDRSDALTIMSLLSEYKSFDDLTDDEKSGFDGEEFARKAKEIRITTSQSERESEAESSELPSLYDLIQSVPKQAAKLLTYEDYFEFAQSPEFSDLSKASRDYCTSHLCEKLSRKFFLDWAIYPFYELIHKRLPILCCEMIIENLNNEDLYNICLRLQVQQIRTV
ncbi:unnamed protein product [Trichogramma brassicae]|uniref:Uncharacterized protein n=1 Tax=Trichogramma brassicae TaxID=86971 RepID=A0A6H5I348_9HYME|nr:unnamed protein product [Trichogramma brassicae]